MIGIGCEERWGKIGRQSVAVIRGKAQDVIEWCPELEKLNWNEPEAKYVLRALSDREQFYNKQCRIARWKEKMENF